MPHTHDPSGSLGMLFGEQNGEPLFFMPYTNSLFFEENLLVHSSCFVFPAHPRVLVTFPAEVSSPVTPHVLEIPI